MVYKSAIQLDLFYDKAWGKYAKENNIENPFKKLWEYEFTKMPNDEVEISPGIKVKPVLTTTFDMEAYTALMPTEEEIAAYRTAECGWKAARILPHVSWGEFVEWAKGRDSWIDVNDYCPCDSKDGHCSFACAKFGDKCPYGK